MTQVIVVNQATGVYHCIDTEGNVVGHGDDQLRPSAATVLMNRLADGHVELEAGYIAYKLDMAGIAPADYFEIHDLVALKPDGEPRRIAIEKRELVDQWLTISDRSGCSKYVGVLDLAAQTLRWLANPLADDPYTSNMLEASCVKCETGLEHVMNSAIRVLETKLTSAQVLITTYVKD